jgi:hypothetical protein
MECQKCTFQTAREMVAGKLTWGRFCTYPVYALDQPPAVITDKFKCPCMVEELKNDEG